MHEADSPQEWFRLALSEAAAARQMMIAGLYRHAFQHAGFAFECALKGRLMRAMRLNTWPSDRRSPYRSDDLVSLARYAGVAADLELLVEEGDINHGGSGLW